MNMKEHKTDQCLPEIKVQKDLWKESEKQNKEILKMESNIEEVNC